MTPIEKYDKNPFKVPEGYFEGLTDRILQNTVEVEKSRHRPKLAILRPLLSLAAVIAGAAIITMAVLQLAAPSGTGAAVSDGEVLADVPQFLIDGIDMYYIESEIDVQGSAVPSSLTEDHEQIIEYLLLTDVEMSLLYELLEERAQL